jgi:ribokinase
LPTFGETVLGLDYAEPLDGGKGSNQAIAAARLGASTAFVGVVGQDRRGDEAITLLASNGVNVDHCTRSSSQATGAGVILLDPSGTPAMVTVPSANLDLGTVDVDRALTSFSDARMALVQLEIAPQVALHAMREAKRRGLGTILNAAPALLRANELSDQGIDVLVVNETEAQALLQPGVEPPEAAFLARAIKEETGIDAVLVTLGPSGMVGCDGNGEWTLKAPSVESVDTSGAGDVFCSALAVNIIAGTELRIAAELATVAAANSVTRPGTIEAFPTVADLMDA